VQWNKAQGKKTSKQQENDRGEGEGRGKEEAERWIMEKAENDVVEEKIKRGEKEDWRVEEEGERWILEKEKSSEDSKQEWDECLILIPFLLLLLIMLHIFFNIFFVYLSLSSCFSPYPFFLIPFLMRFFFLAPFYSLPSFTPFVSCFKSYSSF